MEMLTPLSLLWCSDLIPLRRGQSDLDGLCTYATVWVCLFVRGCSVYVCAYPAVKALAVGAGSSEVDIRVLADLVDGLGLTGHTLQIHHGNMATLDEHLSHTQK